MLISLISFSSLEDLGVYDIIIGGSSIIILSYFANVLAKRTHIPSVLVLIAMGIGIKKLMEIFLGYGDLPHQDLILELLGKVGLIFIILEAALDLKLSKEKLPLILKSATVALMVLVCSSIGIAYFLQEVLMFEGISALIYAIPLSIMSSAIIIPSVSSLSEEKKEFMIYESTFSDIWGIMAFYIVIKNVTPGSTSEIAFSIGKTLGFALIIAIVVSYLLVYVLQKIKSSVKVFLSIAVLLLIYSIQAKLKLGGELLSILIFGLMLNNSRVFFPKIFKNKDGESWFGSLLNKEKMKGLSHDFHNQTLESAFVIRTFFFVMFGVTVSLSEIMNLEVVFYGLSISLILYVARLVWLFLFRVKEPLSLLYIAPRGLITVLLFFQLQTNSDYDHIKEMADGKFDSAILLVVILVTCLIMTFSLIRQGKKLSSNDVSIVGDSSDSAEQV